MIKKIILRVLVFVLVAVSSAYVVNKINNINLDKVSRKAIYEFVCPACKKPFTAYGDKNRKYCCHECYVADRFGRDF